MSKSKVAPAKRKPRVLKPKSAGRHRVATQPSSKPDNRVARRLQRLEKDALLWNYRVLVTNARTKHSPIWMRTSHQERLKQQQPLYLAEFRRRRLKVPDPSDAMAYDENIPSVHHSRRRRSKHQVPKRSRPPHKTPRTHRREDAMSRRLPGSGWTRQR